MPQDNSPLTPAEPPVTSSAADRMAQVQRPSGFDALGFLHKSRAPTSVPLTDFRSNPHDDRRPRLPQLIQPMQSGANDATDTSRASRSSFNPLSIGNLLTAQDSLPQRDDERQRTYAEDATQQPYRSIVSPLHGGIPRNTLHSGDTNETSSAASQPATDGYTAGGQVPRVQQTPTLPVPSRQPSIPSPRDHIDSPASATHSQAPSFHSRSSNYSPLISPNVAYPSPHRIQTVQPPPFTYELTIRQQPVAARACGYGERDRRVVDPPPVLELKIIDQTTGAPIQDLGGLLALSCELTSADEESKESGAKATSDLPPSRRLMGTTVASPYQAKDEHGIAGTFFVFSDLSCRSPGQYRLRYSLVRVDPMMMITGTRHPTVATIETDVFAVYAAKDFPGMRASSELLKALREQGLNVGLKKGVEARGRKKKRDAEAGSESSDDQAGSESGSDGNAGSESPQSVRPKAKGGKRGRKKRTKMEP